MSAGWSSRFSRMRAAFNHNNNNFASNTYSQSSNAFEPATNNRRMVAQTVAKSYLAPWQSQRIDEDEKEDLYSNNGRMRRHARDAQNSSDEDEVSSEEDEYQVRYHQNDARDRLKKRLNAQNLNASTRTTTTTTAKPLSTFDLFASGLSDDEDLEEDIISSDNEQQHQQPPRPPHTPPQIQSQHKQPATREQPDNIQSDRLSQRDRRSPECPRQSLSQHQQQERPQITETVDEDDDFLTYFKRKTIPEGLPKKNFEKNNRPQPKKKSTAQRTSDNENVGIVMRTQQPHQPRKQSSRKSSSKSRSFVDDDDVLIESFSDEEDVKGTPKKLTPHQPRLSSSGKHNYQEDIEDEIEEDEQPLGKFQWGKFGSTQQPSQSVHTRTPNNNKRREAPATTPPTSSKRPRQLHVQPAYEILEQQPQAQSRPIKQQSLEASAGSGTKLRRQLFMNSKFFESSDAIPQGEEVEDGFDMANADTTAMDVDTDELHGNFKFSLQAAQASANQPAKTSLLKPGKKLAGSNFASRLQKALSSLQSDHMYIQHKQSLLASAEHATATAKTPMQDSEVVVRILRERAEPLLYFTVCKVISRPNGDATGLPQPQQHDHSAEAGSEFVDVIFAASIQKELGLSVGKSVKLLRPFTEYYDPQQRRRVILCTFFCKDPDLQQPGVDGSEGAEDEAMNMAEDVEAFQSTFSHGSMLSTAFFSTMAQPNNTAAVSPTARIPTVATPQKTARSPSIPNFNNRAATATAAASPFKRYLQNQKEVASAQLQLAPSEARFASVCDSISALSLFDFTNIAMEAVIQRVLHHADPNQPNSANIGGDAAETNIVQRRSTSIFLQERETGELCQMDVPASEVENWKGLFKEGATFALSRLTIQKKTAVTRRKIPDLYSFLENLKQEASSIINLYTIIPPYVSVEDASPLYKEIEIKDTTATTKCKYSPAQWLTVAEIVAEIMQDDSRPHLHQKRFSLKTEIVYVRCTSASKGKTREPLCILFVKDDSTDKYVKVYICHVAHCNQLAPLLENSAALFVSIRDLLLRDDATRGRHCVADQYTSFVFEQKQQQRSSDDNLEASLPLSTATPSTMHLYDLCSMRGMVIERTQVISADQHHFSFGCPTCGSTSIQQQVATVTTTANANNRSGVTCKCLMCKSEFARRAPLLTADLIVNLPPRHDNDRRDDNDNDNINANNNNNNRIVVRVVAANVTTCSFLAADIPNNNNNNNKQQQQKEEERPQYYSFTGRETIEQVSERLKGKILDAACIFLGHQTHQRTEDDDNITTTTTTWPQFEIITRGKACWANAMKLLLW